MSSPPFSFFAISFLLVLNFYYRTIAFVGAVFRVDFLGLIFGILPAVPINDTRL
jgi:hypothetical protein